MTDKATLVHYAANLVVFGRDVNGMLHVLIVQRGGHAKRGQWGVPGGHVEPGETAEAAALREAYEETGIMIKYGHRIHEVCLNDDPDPAPRGRYVVRTFYVELDDMPQARPLSDDVLACRWVSAHAPGELVFDHNDLVLKARRLVLPRIELRDYIVAITPGEGLSVKRGLSVNWETRARTPELAVENALRYHVGDVDMSRIQGVYEVASWDKSKVLEV